MTSLGRARIVLVILLLIVFSGLGVFLSVDKEKTSVPGTPTPTVNELPKSEEQVSWEKFAKSAREGGGEDVSVDYDAYHQYGEERFGILVVGWKDSEYEIDLYHYDPGRKDWELSPVIEESAYATDIPTASKKWGVPGSVIKGWIDRADREVQKIYQSEME